MKSAQVKAIYAEFGIKVRVRDLKTKFNIVPLKGWEPTGGYDGVTAAKKIAAAAGLTDVLGYAGAEDANGYLIAYKPGVIRRIVR